MSSINGQYKENNSLCRSTKPRYMPLNSPLRVREPVKRTKGRVVGYYPSTKSNAAIAWESQLELKACAIFEFCPTIYSYRDQPLSIYFENEHGSMSRYTPDFELTNTKQQLVYVEVKPSSKLEKQEEILRFQKIDKVFKQEGFQFVVITEKELDNPELQRNFKLLRSYQRVEVSEQVKIKAITHIENNDMATFAELATYLASKAYVYSLLANHVVEADLNAPLRLTTKLYKKLEAENEISIFSYRIAPNFK